MMEKEYAHPEMLVDTDWVEGHLDDPHVRAAEVDYDPLANYRLGHIPGSVLFDWKRDINDPARRDVLSAGQLEELFERYGVSPDTTLVPYGDFNNWFAAFAVWLFDYYGIPNVRLMNGGRQEWIEEDRPLTREVPHPPATRYPTLHPQESLRAYYEEVRGMLPAVAKGTVALVDVRGPKEFSGEMLAPPEYPTENAQRGGHIPMGVNIPQGPGGARGRDLQEPHRAGEALPEPWDHTREGDRHLLPHRGALQPHVVRVEASRGVRPGPELRRLVGRVGEPDPQPHRTAAALGHLHGGGWEGFPRFPVPVGPREPRATLPVSSYRGSTHTPNSTSWRSSSGCRRPSTSMPAGAVVGFKSGPPSGRREGHPCPFQPKSFPGTIRRSTR